MEPLNSLLIELAKAVGYSSPAIAVVLILAFWGRERFKAYLSGEIQRAQAQQNQELARALESFKHDLEENLTRSRLFIERQHDVYKRLRAKIVRTHGAVSNFSGFGYHPNYANYTDDEMREYLKRLRASSNEIRDVINAREANQTTGMHKFHMLRRRLEVGDLRHQFADAKNYFLLNRIYLSDDVASCADTILFDKFANLVASYSTEVDAKGHYMDPDRPEITKTLDPLLDDLTTKIIADLRGH